jgi:hypothetical protein
MRSSDHALAEPGRRLGFEAQGDSTSGSGTTDDAEVGLVFYARHDHLSR